MPLRMFLAVRRTLVKTHRVREGDLKEVVIPCRQTLQYIRQTGAPTRIQRFDLANVPFTEQQSFKRPGRPERHNGKKEFILADDPFARCQLQRRIVTQKAASVFPSIFLERVLLPSRLVRNGLRGPDLPMRMRIAAPHHRASVLENLDVVDIWKIAQTSILFCPHINEVANFSGRHLCQRQLVTRGETDHATNAALGGCDKKIVSTVVDPQGSQITLQRGEVVFKNKDGGILRITNAARPRVPRTQIAVWIVRGGGWMCKLLRLSLPRALRAIG